MITAIFTIISMVFFIIEDFSPFIIDARPSFVNSRLADVLRFTCICSYKSHVPDRDFEIIVWFLPKLYVNTLLSTLNARANWNKSLEHGATYFSGIRYAQNPAGSVKNVSASHPACSFHGGPIFLRTWYTYFIPGREYHRGKFLYLFRALQIFTNTLRI